MAHPRRNHRGGSAGSGRPVFVDTGFWLAFVVVRDQYRELALAWNAWLAEQRRSRLTTESVLYEVLNALAHPRYRTRAAEIYRRCQAGDAIELVRFEPGQLDDALQIYERRKDESWSLADCLSFIVMRQRGLTEALTADRHFQQAGFRALLLDKAPVDS